MNFLLFLFLIPHFSTFEETEKECDDESWNFTSSLVKMRFPAFVAPKKARFLAEKCPKLRRCEQSGLLKFSVTNLYRVNIKPSSDFLNLSCDYWQLLGGPLGECLREIRVNRTEKEVYECVTGLNFTENRRGRDVREDQHARMLIVSCESVVNQCVKDLVKSDCEAGILEIFEKNQGILEQMNWVGIEIYKRRNVFGILNYNKDYQRIS